MNTTKSTKLSEIQRAWHIVDLEGKTLGRVSSSIAKILIGKSKSYFVRNLDCGDYVVAINASKIKVTGKKESDKRYFRYSGYPGGLKSESFTQAMKKDPKIVINHAIKGMLPQNRLRDTMLKRLFVFPGAEHKYNDKFKVKSSTPIKSGTK